MKTSVPFIPWIIYISILCSFISCGNTEEFNPIGVWEEIGNPENKMVLQNKDDIEIAIRRKGSFRWEIYSKEITNFYTGTEDYNLALFSNDSMEIFNKEMRQFKKIYKKKNSKIEGFWLLNLLMPRETVKEIVGEPDSISTEHQMEEWFYGSKKVIRFNKTGIFDFSENNFSNPNFSSIQKGDHYRTVIKKIGDPYFVQQTKLTNDSISHYLFYNGKNTKFTLKDSIVQSIYLDLPRYQKEWMTIIDCKSLDLSFNLDKTTNEGIFVEEKGKIVDHLIPEFSYNDSSGFLRFYGKKYHILVRIDDDNTFKAAYSRPITRRRYKEDNLEVKTIDDMFFSLNAELFNQNRMGAYIYLKIKEPHSKNTVISGTFIINIPKKLK